ncbi:hypothetical protein N7517_002617 [Penicillium concentricum]|uniref:Uncharacterized protein n=1 Tax=Penicillium concentricum TaxID=293559 RepID=A0A9W9SU08_9EURO|nr:uncharacterized protein N7517_002617 [Penicillium concentricum]KAJ5384706.1 hypothetical protein N7517_002617 [Penicillium concentricum]
MGGRQLTLRLPLQASKKSIPISRYKYLLKPVRPLLILYTQPESGTLAISSWLKHKSEEAPRERRMKRTRGRDLEIPKHTQLHEEGNAVALECVAESIESSSYVQSTCNETVRNDLADIFARLAIVETEMKKVAKRVNNKVTEGQSIRRSLRRGNSDSSLISAIWTEARYQLLLVLRYLYVIRLPKTKWNRR